LWNFHAQLYSRGEKRRVGTRRGRRPECRLARKGFRRRRPLAAGHADDRDLFTLQQKWAAAHRQDPPQRQQRPESRVDARLRSDEHGSAALSADYRITVCPSLRLAAALAASDSIRL